MSSTRRTRFTVSCPASRAFTLIELLVVIAIIAILAAFLFPVFAQARSQARKAACVSNLKQLAVAFRMYADDYDAKTPISTYFNCGAGCLAPTTFAELRQRWFMDPTQPYVKNLTVLHCPADNVTNGDRATGAELLSMADDPRIPRLSYGVNLYLGGIVDERAGYSDADLPYPAQTAMIADCALSVFGCVVERERDGTRYSSIAYANAIRPRDLVNICRLGVPGEERHGSGSNVLFVDSHARFIPSDRFLDRKEVRGGFGVHVQYPIVDPKAVPPQ
jgi:prepilin-type N-terminal cleavage/methylation domain-containing protein/prepilin-type processing-associated H-X9-DG protein